MDEDTENQNREQKETNSYIPFSVTIIVILYNSHYLPLSLSLSLYIYIYIYICSGLNAGHPNSESKTFLTGIFFGDAISGKYLVSFSGTITAFTVVIMSSSEFL